jgi:hypothetical protein
MFRLTDEFRAGGLEAFSPKCFPPERMKAIPGSPVLTSREGRAGRPRADPVSHRSGLLACEQKPSHPDAAQTL